MASQIWVNLPVKNLKQSVDFFTKLGFTFDPKYTNENATCMIIGPNIFAMLLVESFFKTFTTKEICDATKQTEVLVCLTLDSRMAIDKMVTAAKSAGGSVPTEAKDNGFMYGHAFHDLDGHIWELLCMTK